MLNAGQGLPSGAGRWAGNSWGILLPVPVESGMSVVWTLCAEDMEAVEQLGVCVVL